MDLPIEIVQSGWTETILLGAVGSLLATGVVYLCSRRSSPEFFARPSNVQELHFFCARLGEFLPEGPPDINKVLRQSEANRDTFFTLKRATGRTSGTISAVASLYPIRREHSIALTTGEFDLRVLLNEGVDTSQSGIHAFYLGFAWATDRIASAALLKTLISAARRIAAPQAVIACRPTTPPALQILRNLSFRPCGNHWGMQLQLKKPCFTEVHALEDKAVELRVLELPGSVRDSVQ